MRQTQRITETHYFLKTHFKFFESEEKRIGVSCKFRSFLCLGVDRTCYFKNPKAEKILA